MSDLERIAEIEELNRKRTPGEWRVVRNRGNHWGMIEVEGPGVGGRIVIGFTVTPDVDYAKASQIEATAEFIAEEANACEWLLELAKRGGELELVIASLRNYELNGSNAAKQISGIYADFDETTAQLAAVTAERDKLLSLLKEAHDFIDLTNFRERQPGHETIVRTLREAIVAAQEGK